MVYSPILQMFNFVLSLFDCGWFAESLVLLRKGTDTGDPYSWTIDTVDTEDTGLYSCVAGNILGETVHIAHLEVSPAPRPRPAPPGWALLGALLAAR